MDKIKAEMPETLISNAETANRIRQYVESGPHGLFSWATDSCGYDQHCRFARYRNKNWNQEKAAQMSFNMFLLEYADLLEKELPEFEK